MSKQKKRTRLVGGKPVNGPTGVSPFDPTPKNLKRILEKGLTPRRIRRSAGVR